MLGGGLLIGEVGATGLTGNLLRIIYAFSRSAASKPHQESPAYTHPSQLVGKYPYLALLEGLPCALAIVTHIKTPEILGGSGSKILLEHLPLYLLRNKIFKVLNKVT